jgi:hypothetical protein
MKIKKLPFLAPKPRRAGVTAPEIGAEIVEQFHEHMKGEAARITRAIRDGEYVIEADADSEDRTARIRRIGRSLMQRLDEDLVLLEIEDRLRRARLLDELLATVGVAAESPASNAGEDQAAEAEEAKA